MFLKLFLGVRGFASGLRALLIILALVVLGVDTASDHAWTALWRGYWMPMSVTLLYLTYRALKAWTVSRTWKDGGFTPAVHTGWRIAVDDEKRLVAFGSRVLPVDSITYLHWKSKEAHGWQLLGWSELTVYVDDPRRPSMKIAFANAEDATNWAARLKAV